MLPSSPYPESLGVIQYASLPWYVQHFDILISSVQPSCSARLCLCADFKATWIYSSVALPAHPSNSERLWSRRCEPETVLVFFNKKGNNNKSYRLITHSPITPPPSPSEPQNPGRGSITLLPPSITPFIMRLIWLLVWLSVQQEELQIRHSLYCWGSGGGGGEVFGCWQEWKTALGRMWACVGVYGDVWAWSTEVYKSKQMIVSHSDPLCRSKCVSHFIFSSFQTVHPSVLIIFLLFLAGADLSGGPCIIRSSGGCWETGDKF